MFEYRQTETHLDGTGNVQILENCLQCGVSHGPHMKHELLSCGEHCRVLKLTFLVFLQSGISVHKDTNLVRRYILQGRPSRVGSRKASQTVVCT